MKNMKDLTFPELKVLGKESIPINKHRLEIESETQPQLFCKWFSYHEDLSADVKEAKHNLMALREYVSLHIRRMSKKRFEKIYKLPLPSRLTDSLLTSLVGAREDVKSCSDKLFALERRLGLVKSIVDSAKMRKSMIEVLTSLFIAKYWSKPEADAFRKRKKIK